MSTDIKLPIEYIIVAGEEAVEKCLNIRADKTKGLMPVIIGTIENAEYVANNYIDNELSVEDIIINSEEFVIDNYINEMIDDIPDIFEGFQCDEWPLIDLSLIKLSAHIDKISGKPLKEVCIGLIPTTKPYEVPAYLKYGNCWSDCPDSDIHVGIHKYWFEKYGAEIISSTDHIIECTVSNPPITKEEALDLANEQFIYCKYIVIEEAGSIEALASKLMNCKYWCFRWE